MKDKLLSTLAAAFIGLLTSPDYVPAQTYTIIDVGANRTVNAVNDLGLIAGTENYPAVRKTPATTRGFLWSNGTKTDLGTLPGGTFSNARSINNHGQIVGYGNVPGSGDTWRAVVWDNMKGIRDLNQEAAPGGLTAASQGWILHTAFGINENGQIVGWGERVGDPARPNGYLWQLDSFGNAVVQRLPMGTEYAEAETRGINDFGQVVSSVRNTVVDTFGGISYWPLAAVWEQNQDGTTALNTLGLLENGRESHAFGLNNGGEAVGYAVGTNGRRSAVYWSSNSTAPMSLGTLGGADSNAFEISESGQVVGWAHTSLGNQRAFVWDGANGLRDLNLLSNVGATWVLQLARSISPNTGFIVGNGYIKVKLGTQARAYLLRP